MSVAGAIAVNELTNLVKRNSAASLQALASDFPEFAEELKGGVTLGRRDEAQAFVERKAKLAISLCKGVIDVVTKRIEALKRTLARQGTRKIVLISVGGISGVATLAAMGFSTETATRIGAIVTSAVAAGNAVHEYLIKGAERNIDVTIGKLSQATFSLTVLTQELEAAVQTHVNPATIERLVNKANKVAEELNTSASALGI